MGLFILTTTTTKNILKLKNTVSEIEISLDGFSSRLIALEYRFELAEIIRRYSH